MAGAGGEAVVLDAGGAARDAEHPAQRASKKVAQRPPDDGDEIGNEECGDEVSAGRVRWHA